MRTQEQQAQFNKNRQLKIFKTKSHNVMTQSQIDPILKNISINEIDINDIDNAIKLLKEIKAMKKQKIKLEELGVFVQSEPTKAAPAITSQIPKAKTKAKSEKKSKTKAEKKSKKKSEKKSKPEKKPETKLKIPKAILQTKKRDIRNRYMKLHNDLLNMNEQTLNIYDKDKLKKLQSIRQQVKIRMESLVKLA